jgi:hypothetical protein
MWNFIVCTSLKYGGIYSACSTHGMYDKCIQHFSLKIKDDTREN